MRISRAGFRSTCEWHQFSISKDCSVILRSINANSKGLSQALIINSRMLKCNYRDVQSHFICFKSLASRVSRDLSTLL